MKYIAYGSNMVEEQMAHRCPGAKLIGTGYLPNHRLEFYLHATVERARAHGAKVPVAVWEISEADERSLDRYEGYPTYYTKYRRRVVMNDGTELWGMVYIMNMIRPQPPTVGYYNAIAYAYEKLGIGAQVGSVLEPAQPPTASLPPVIASSSILPLPNLEAAFSLPVCPHVGLLNLLEQMTARADSHPKQGQRAAREDKS